MQMDVEDFLALGRFAVRQQQVDAFAFDVGLSQGIGNSLSDFE